MSQKWIDRFIAFAPLLISLGGVLGIVAAFRPGYGGLLLLFAGAAILSSLLGLLPWVVRARIRLMRLKYPPEG